jgi:bacterioferritin-associated ferredoxin
MPNICLCKKISQSKMEAVYKEGAVTVNKIKYKTGAGSGACKGLRCTPKIEALIKELEQVSDPV